MWSCCGFGRRKPPKSREHADERTPLIDPDDILPFVAPAQTRVVDDEALLEYQRRLDRIIEEAAEKIVSVTTPAAHLDRILSSSDGTPSSPSTSSSNEVSSSPGMMQGTSSGSRNGTQDPSQRGQRSSGVNGRGQQAIDGTSPTEDEDSGDDSGEETPTGTGGELALSRTSARQDPRNSNNNKSVAQLDSVLAMSEEDFAKLLLQG